ncbi:MAG: hypothetical protein M0C28_23780 [Candidatus Moduliflexus flocculans]|nr:hypothetical protein [Candidatus Moduliflexus flocculans]
MAVARPARARRWSPSSSSSGPARPTRPPECRPWPPPTARMIGKGTKMLSAEYLENMHRGHRRRLSP